MSGRWRGRSEDAPALRYGRMVLHRLDEQTALVAQPDCPGESGGALVGDGLTFEAMLAHKMLRYF